MTVSVLQERQASNGSTGATSLGLAFSSNNTAGSSIHGIAGQLDAGPPVLSMADANGSYTLLDTKDDTSPAAQQFIAHFNRDNIAAGANTVTVTSTLSQTFLAIWIREIGGTSGIDVHAANLQVNPGTGTNAITSGSATPTVQPGLISALCINAVEAVAPTVGTGLTLGANGWLFGGAATSTTTEHKRYTSTAAAAATFTAPNANADDFITVAAFYKESGGATYVPDLVLAKAQMNALLVN